MSRGPTTIIATASTAGEAKAEVSVLAVSVGVLLDPSGDMGVESFFAHRQPELGPPLPRWQQQQPCPDRNLPQQQHLAVPLPQHEAFRTGTVPPAQPQPGMGMASAGISRATTHIKVRTIIA
jgi:hypothetical protein